MTDDAQSASLPPELPPEQSPSRKKLDLSDYVAFIAALVALISLVVSVRSCQQVDRSLNLTERDFEASRKVFWIGEIVDTHKLRLSPSNPDAIIQSVRFTFPNVFKMYRELDSINVLGDSNTISLVSIRDTMIQLIPNEVTFTNGTISMGPSNRTSTKYHDGIDLQFRLVTNTASTTAVETRISGQDIPLVIETRHLAKGEIYSDTSLYYLPYVFTFVLDWKSRSNSLRVTSFVFKPLQFGEHIENREPKAFIEKMWNKNM